MNLRTLQDDLKACSDIGASVAMLLAGISKVLASAGEDPVRGHALRAAIETEAPGLLAATLHGTSAAPEAPEDHDAKAKAPKAKAR